MFLKDLFFPKMCFRCGALGSFVCIKCSECFDFLGKDTCIYCKKGSFLGITHPNCRRPAGIDAAASILRYDNSVKQYLKLVKYRLTKDMMSELLTLCGAAIIDRIVKFRSISHSFFIVPIPLHSSKLRTRGFNQTEEIARFVGRISDCRTEQIIKKDKNTKPQAQLPRGIQRINNIKGAFSFIKKEADVGKTAVLVDDVITTGATIKEGARVLKHAGVKQVFAFSLAKG